MKSGNLVGFSFAVCFGAALLLAGCGGGVGRNSVHGTVADEKSQSFPCRVQICKHDSGHLCNHTLEGTPCKFERTDLVAEVKNGRFRLDDVPPIDRKELAYAAVVLTGTNELPQSFFIFPDNPTPTHKAFTLGFANKGAIVNIVVKPTKQAQGAPGRLPDSPGAPDRLPEETGAPKPQ